MVKTLSGKTTKIVGLILISVGVCLASAGEKELELDRALRDIRASAQLIGERAATAAAVLGQLQDQSQALKSEILQERHRGGAVTFRQALQISRINYDLRLLQQVEGYLVQLQDRLAYFRAATTRLNAYREHVQDDRLMLRAIENVDNSGLLRQIREVLKEYQRQCAAPLLNAKTACGPRELEILWNDIVKSP
jgi:hypothetical protein